MSAAQQRPGRLLDDWRAGVTGSRPTLAGWRSRAELFYPPAAGAAPLRWSKEHHRRRDRFTIRSLVLIPTSVLRTTGVQRYPMGGGAAHSDTQRFPDRLLLPVQDARAGENASLAVRRSARRLSQPHGSGCLGPTQAMIYTSFRILPWKLTPDSRQPCGHLLQFAPPGAKG